MAYYKQKTKTKEKEVKNLNQRLRAYTLQEKKILIKERAFEMDREELLKRLINLENDLAIARLENQKNKGSFYRYD